MEQSNDYSLFDHERRQHKYILEGKTPVPCNDLMKWALWFEHANRVVRGTIINGYQISTVFLGLDYSFGFSEPKLFETLIFAPYECDLHLYRERCATWQQAERMHERVCNKIRRHLNLLDPPELSFIHVDEAGAMYKKFTQQDKTRAMLNRLKNIYAHQIRR